MPAKLKVNREAIKTLVITHGVREAARLAGQKESTVQAWSARFKWLQNRVQTVQPICNQSPADALANTLQSHKNATRMSLARAARRLAAESENATLKDAPKVLDIAKTAGATFEDWQPKDQTPGIQVNILSGNFPDGPVIDA